MVLTFLNLAPIRFVRRRLQGIFRAARRFTDRSDTLYYWADRFDRRVKHSIPFTVQLISAGSLILAGVELWPAMVAAGRAGTVTLRAYAWDDLAGIGLAILGLVLAFTVSRRKIRESLEALRQITIERDFEFNPGAIKIGGDYAEAGYRIRKYAHGIGLWSSTISSWLLTRTGGPIWPIALDETEFPDAPGIFEALGARLATDLILHGKHFSNDAKVRLKSSPLFQRNPGGTVVLEKTHYIATLCTNDMVGKQALSLAGGLISERYLARELLIGADGALRDWGDIKFAHQLGASSLVFTSDGYMLIVEQTGSNIQSANLLAPSGSGSFDWKDFDGSAGTDFIEQATNAAKRELLEELGLEPLHCGKQVQVVLKPIGFGLYLHRGAKPEMLCLGRIGLSRDEYNKTMRFSSIEEKLSKNRRASHEYNLARATWDAKNVSAACQNLRDSKRDASRLSMPLEMALDMIVEACRKHPGEINSILL